MAGETELERMVVRLLGDATSYMRMLKDSQSEATKTVRRIETATTKIQALGSSLQGFARAAVGALGTIAGASTLKGFLDFHTSQQLAERRLKAAIAATGGEVQSNFRYYQQQARELQDLTTVSDNTSLRMFQMAEATGIFRHSAVRATRNAIALSQALGVSEQSALGLTLQLERGNTEGLEQYIPQLRYTRNEAQKVTIAQNALQRMFGIAEQTAQGAAGTIRQLGNAWQDIKEDLGQVVAEGVLPVLQATRDLIRGFKELSPEAKRVIVAIAAIGPAIVAWRLLGPSIMSVGTSLISLLNPTKLAIGLFTSIKTIIFGIGAAVRFAMGPIGIIVSLLGLAAFAAFKKSGKSVVDIFNTIGETAAIVWKWIQEKVTMFIEWVKPIWNELLYLGEQVWEGIKVVAESAWEIIKTVVGAAKDVILGIFRVISFGGIQSWSDVRDFIVQVIRTITFTIQNFKDVVLLAWTAIKLGAVVAWDAVLDALKVTAAAITGSVFALGRVFGALWTNLRAGAERAWNFIRSGFHGLGRAATAIFRGESPIRAFREAQQAELRRLSQQATQFANIGRAASEGYRQGYDTTIRALGGTGPSALQNTLRAEFNQQRDALRERWREFNREREEAQNATEDSGGQRARLREQFDYGRNLARQRQQGEIQQIQQNDAVLAASNEARRKLHDQIRGYDEFLYRENIRRASERARELGSVEAITRPGTVIGERTRGTTRPRAENLRQQVSPDARLSGSLQSQNTRPILTQIATHLGRLVTLEEEARRPGGDQRVIVENLA